MSDWQTITQGFYLEALLIDGDRIWYSDVTQGGVRLVGGEEVLLPDRMLIGGLLLNDDGALLVAGPDGIAHIHPDSGTTGMLVEGIGGVNEMRSDGQGGIIFGSIDIASIIAGKQPGPSAIWHLSQDRTLTKIKDGLAFANGLSLSPDGQTLYFNESFAGVRAFAFDGARPLGDPLWQLEKYDCDGMALDADGNVWVTGFGSDHALRLSPEGAELDRLSLPGAACTNIRFGGPNLDTAYFCIVDPEGAQALAEGRPIEEQKSMLVKTQSPVIGAPIAPAHFGALA